MTIQLTAKVHSLGPELSQFPLLFHTFNNFGNFQQFHLFIKKVSFCYVVPSTGQCDSNNSQQLVCRLLMYGCLLHSCLYSRLFKAFRSLCFDSVPYVDCKKKETSPSYFLHADEIICVFTSFIKNNFFFPFPNGYLLKLLFTRWMFYIKAI